jgi:hypothetical protein
MKRMMIVAALAAIGSSLAADGATVPYPQDYRAWQHVKSMVIEPGHALYESFGGIHHIYANQQALEGYRTGVFPDGAVIAFDLLAATSGDHAMVEGERKVLGVMHKDSAKFAATGGWGFEGYAAGDPQRPVVGANAASACFACHLARKDHGYVFSEVRP